MNKCLSCKGRLQPAPDGTYGGDFCSEFCFSSYPGNASRLRNDRPARYAAAQPHRDVERILKRNHDILMAFRHWREESPTMADIGSLQWLREKGFDFAYHTHVAHGRDGGTELWCYDAGYRLERDGSVEPL